MQISIEAMQRFFSGRASDLKRIMYGARGDVELGDVQSEAYVIANEIQDRRGRVFDFDNAEDQDTLLGGLWNRIVKFSERYFRSAVAIDDDPDEDGSSLGAAMARTLQAPATSDPALLLQQEQEAIEDAARAEASYSEAVAYVHLLRRFADDKTLLAVYLCIALTTLGLRLRRAEAVVKVQPSVFDGVERVPPDFQPTIGKPKSQREQVELRGEQWAWSF